jgi:hypothetical protein
VPEAVSNTSPFQYLFQLDLVGLLPRFYSKVIVPQAVVDELAEGRRNGIVLPDLAGLPWVEVRSVGAANAMPLAADLGAGEREALILAAGMPGSILIIDDALGRRYAALHGLRVTGTLGVILRAKREGHLPSVRPVLDRLDELRFRVDPATRASVLGIAGET